MESVFGNHAIKWTRTARCLCFAPSQLLPNGDGPEEERESTGGKEAHTISELTGP